MMISQIAFFFFIGYEKKKKIKLTKNSLYFLLNVNHAQYQTHQLIYIKCKILWTINPEHFYCLKLSKFVMQGIEN